MVTHEWNAVPCFLMANWCWYTANVALINIGRNRELTQNWYISLLMKRSECSHLSLLASDGGLFTDGEQGQATRRATQAAEKIKQGIGALVFTDPMSFWSICVDRTDLTFILCVTVFYQTYKVPKCAPPHLQTQTCTIRVICKFFTPIKTLCCLHSLLGPT